MRRCRDGEGGGGVAAHVAHGTCEDKVVLLPLCYFVCTHVGRTLHGALQKIFVTVVSRSLLNSDFFQTPSHSIRHLSKFYKAKYTSFNALKGLLT